MCIQSRSVGIMGQWIDSWRPRDNSDAEIALMLEDDMIVSMYAWRWLRAVHRFYGQRSDFAGATLQSHTLFILSDDRKGPLPLVGPKSDTVFMFKSFGPWGFSPRPFHWRRFQVG